ncbi:MAG: hypothetical protein LBG10_08545, partial [Treponema sp.]|nr:hypothetical protein [Treponema sp.]
MNSYKNFLKRKDYGLSPFQKPVSFEKAPIVHLIIRGKSGSRARLGTAGFLHLLLLREINPPEAWKPTWAQGIVGGAKRDTAAGCGR